MAFTYGFYNSLNGDRKYNAFQMTQMFDGIILDGVFEAIGQHFAVTAAGGMTVNVGTGRAWFNHTWNDNDSVMPITLPLSDLNRSRYDAVVIEVGDPNTDRTNKIKVVSGEAAVNPVKPTLNRGATNNDTIDPDSTTLPPYQHALAYILVKPGAEAITAEDIEIVVGMNETPFVTGPLETRSIEELFNQWDAQFNTWFSNLKAQLTDNVVTNLQMQIDELKTADHVFITNAVANDIGVPVGSSVEYVLNYLDDEHQALIEAIKNSANFVKTADYTSPGTYTYRANGTKVFAIIVGGGGGGGRGGYTRPNNSYCGGGGSGGYGAAIVITEIVNISKGSTYPIVVGAAGLGANYSDRYEATDGGTSSAFGSTARGGYGGRNGESNGIGAVQGTSSGYGGGGGYGGKAQNVSDPVTLGGNGSSYTASGNDMSYTTYGGGGGGGGGYSKNSSVYTSGGNGGSSSGGGNGGNGGKAGLSTTQAYGPGSNGSTAIMYGCGGGGGGGSGYNGGGYAEDIGNQADGGNGGNGCCGRVIIYEAGAFVIG